MASNDLQYQSDVGISHYDRAYINRIETIFLLELFIVFDRFHTDIIKENVSDWTTARTVYEAKAEISVGFQHMSSDRALGNSFGTYKIIYQELARLCLEIGAAAKGRRITPAQDAYLYFYLLKLNGESVLIRRSDLNAIKPWLDRHDLLAERMKRAEQSLNQHLQENYGFNIAGMSQEVIPLPLGGGGSEANYLYLVFIKETNLSDFLKVQYKNDFIRLAGNFAIEVGFKATEIFLFYGDFIEQKIRLGGLADLMYGSIIDCLDSNRKASRKQYLTDSLALHRAILSELNTGSERVSYLIRFFKDDIKLYAKNLTGNYLNAYNDRLAVLEELLRQRTEKLVPYVEKLETMALNALQRFNAGEDEILRLNEFEKGILKFFFSRKKRDVAPGPCSLWNTLNS